MTNEIDHGLTECTVMFYFAGDNPLASLLVSQLKAIKDAGFQKTTDVLVYFDPNEPGIPTCLYHVNEKRRRASEEKTAIGDNKDSFVRNMFEDKVELSDPMGPAAKKMKEFLDQGDTVPAHESLKAFLDYCQEVHPSKHYFVFLVGHGMVVGNDAFLPDEEPASAITLKQLQAVMKGFKSAAGDAFELLALHSCSMSSVEVGYELRDTAKFMMASEGLSFVGSWPYRQLLKNIFNAVEKGEVNSPDGIALLLEHLYFLSYYNAKDFLLAGYPLELSLCSLASDRFRGLSDALAGLVRAMREGLRDPILRDVIQLAHLESQSYYDENYTDLYDFCFCLVRKCSVAGIDGPIKDCAAAVKERLESQESSSLFGALVIHSLSFGWKYQYSHGLSIYFPWAEPYQKPRKRDSRESRPEKAFMPDYANYDLNVHLGNDSWLNFLKDYFTLTKRESRVREDGRDTREEGRLEENMDGGSWKEVATDWLALTDKPTGGFDKPTGGYEKPTGGSGTSCSCPSIKNYPKEIV